MTEKIDNFISFVVYTYNCERDIKYCFEVLSEIAQKFAHVELICVDDQSSDNTRRTIIDCSNNFCGSVTLITMGQHQGVEKSITAGVKQSMGDFVYEFEMATIDYEPQLLIESFEVAGLGNDIVFVSNKTYKRPSSTLFYNLFNKNTYLENGTTSNTFRLVSRRAINRVEELGIDVLYRKLGYANCGLKTITIQYEGKRKYSNKQTRADRRVQAMNNFIVLTNIFSKCSSIICILMMVLTIAISVYTLVVFYQGMTVSGYTSTMLVLSGCMCVVFLLFNICIRYLSLLTRMMFNINTPIIQAIDILKCGGKSKKD